MLNKKYKDILVCGIVLLICLIIGVVMAIIVVSSNVYSKASNDGWLAFVGSMVGSFMAGVSSVLLMLINRKELLQMQEEHKRDERQKEVDRIREKLEEMYTLIQINPMDTLYRADLVAIKSSKCIKNSTFYEKILDVETLMEQHQLDDVKAQNEVLQNELYLFEEAYVNANK